jgi:hypothetical protein
VSILRKNFLHISVLDFKFLFEGCRVNGKGSWTPVQGTPGSITETMELLRMAR